MEVIMETNQEFKQYQKASDRVKELKGFYEHLANYLLFNTGFLLVNLYFSPNQLWFFWPLLGWGIGLFFHGVKVFNFFPFINKDWEERKIKQFIEEEKNKNTTNQN